MKFRKTGVTRNMICGFKITDFHMYTLISYVTQPDVLLCLQTVGKGNFFLTGFY